MTDLAPRWDVTQHFPSLSSPEFASAHERLGADVDRLAALYDEHGVRSCPDAVLDDATVDAFEAVIESTNRTLETLRLISAYANTFVAVDARDGLAAGVASQVQSLSARVRALMVRYDAWVASLGAEALVARSIAAADHAFPLEQAERSAAHQMSEAEEGLYADLALTGSTAWNRLHGDVTAVLAASVPGADGAKEDLPITVVRGMATDADPAVRRAAFGAELLAWQGLAPTCAAALNAIKGEALTVSRRRGWTDPLAAALHINAVDRETFDAMQAAVVASLPDWRRYLRAKAVALGSAGPDGGLPWWDLFAPLGNSDAAAVSWSEAVRTVVESFATFSPSLAGLAQTAVEQRWVDAEARLGKRGGAFCVGITPGESRILLNFAPTFDSVSTLAHELGHAYHNVALAERSPLQRATPMALAETASIFCETLLVQAVLASTDDPARRLAVLELDLQGACQVVVDIHSRFLFEQASFERRAERTLSADEYCELMTEAQLAAYGDGLDPSHLHSYMWAVKPHYYATHYYNWPYTFGLLFGMGLYAVYQRDPERFRDGYDDLLSSTGLGSAPDLAQRFGIDVRDQAFWTSSLEVLRARIDQFVGLLPVAGG